MEPTSRTSKQPKKGNKSIWVKMYNPDRFDNDRKTSMYPFSLSFANPNKKSQLDKWLYQILCLTSLLHSFFHGRHRYGVGFTVWSSGGDWKWKRKDDGHIFAMFLCVGQIDFRIFESGIDGLTGLGVYWGVWQSSAFFGEISIGEARRLPYETLFSPFSSIVFSSSLLFSLVFVSPSFFF